jgi:hypothetical protein
MSCECGAVPRCAHDGTVTTYVLMWDCVSLCVPVLFDKLRVRCGRLSLSCECGAAPRCARDGTVNTCGLLWDRSASNGRRSRSIARRIHSATISQNAVEEWNASIKYMRHSFRRLGNGGAQTRVERMGSLNVNHYQNAVGSTERVNHIWVAHSDRK